PTTTKEDENESPFRADPIFLNRFPITELLWRYTSAAARRLLRKPEWHAIYDYVFYQIRFFGKLPRKLIDPTNGQIIRAGYFFGYSNHKSIIRIKSAKDFEFVIHYWRSFSRKPFNIYIGNILHYDLVDYTYFINKFRQRAESMLLKVFYVRYSLGRIAKSLPDDDIKKFFYENIAITKKSKIDSLLKHGIATRISSIKKFFDTSNMDNNP
ncbi:MAG TPA: hypothetical protein DDZ41_11140, partial [Flavobacterium sp.]|nr:hypothetical protein [Flavobacterium sp.]